MMRHARSIVALSAVIVVTASNPAHADCLDRAATPIAQRRALARCGYSRASVVAAGDYTFAVWQSISTVLGHVTVSDLFGGPLNGQGELITDEEALLADNAVTGANIASDGTNFLVAWNDRGGAAGVLVNSKGERIRSINSPSHSSTLGTVSDLAPQFFSPAFVVFNGIDYVVLTGAVRTNPTTGENAPIVVATAYSRDLTIVRSQVIADKATPAALASGRSGQELALLRTADGIVAIELAGIFVTAQRPMESVPATASVSLSGNLLVWHNESVIRARRLDGGSTFVVGSGPNADSLSVVEEGADTHLVLWSRAGTVRGVRIDHRGPDQSFAIGAGFLQGATTTSGGTIVLMKDECGSVASSFLPRGTTEIASRAIVSRTAASQRFLAGVGTSRGDHIIWKEETNSGSYMYASFLGQEGRRTDLNQGGGYVVSAAAIPFRRGSAVAWHESGHVFVSRIDEFGEKIFTTKTSEEERSVQDQAIAATNDAILVVSLDKDPASAFALPHDVFATLIDPEGRVLSRANVGSAESPRSLAAEYESGQWFIGWYEVVWGEGQRHVRVSVSETLTVLGAESTQVPFLGAALAQRLGEDPLLIGEDTGGLHAFFPDRGAAVLLTSSFYIADAKVTKRGDAHEVVWIQSDRQTPGTLTIYRSEVTHQGATPPQALACISPADDARLVMFNGTPRLIARIDEERRPPATLSIRRLPPARRRALR